MYLTPTAYAIEDSHMSNKNHLIIITCTYKRSTRNSYIIQLIEHLKNLEDYTWIVVEDAESIDEKLQKILPDNTIYFAFGRTNDGGNKQRNAALEYIQDSQLSGIIYNADDDNLYDPELFEEIRKTKRLSVFPVAGWGRHISDPERPILNQDGEFLHWNSTWRRKYAVDMGGFAFHSDLLKDLEKPLWKHMGHGGGESEFIDSIIGSISEVEFLCDKCTKSLVEHNGLCSIHHPDIKINIDIQNKIIGGEPRRGKTTGNIPQYREISDKLFNSTLTITTIGQVEDIYNKIDGCFSGPDRTEALAIIKNIKDIRNSSIIEIGAWKGRVSSIISTFMDPSNDLFIVEDFKTDNGLNRLENLNENLKIEFIENIIKPDINNIFLVSQDMLLINWQDILVKPVGYIFYDACPNKEMCFETISMIMAYSDANIIIDFHDAFWPEITAAIDELCERCALEKRYKIDIWEGFVSIGRI